MRVTLDRVIDPYQLPKDPLVVRAPSRGYRWVALQFTVTNIGKTVTPPFDCADPGCLELQFALDPATILDQYGDPLLTSEVGDSVPVNAGATVTVDSPFQISTATRVTSASAELMFAGTSSGPTTTFDEWSIP
jgi:hypothetical protein